MPAAAIRVTEPEDAEAVYELYRAVAARPGGLARAADEITHAYVHDFLNHSREHGLSLVSVTAHEGVVGEIHAYGRALRSFAHVLGDLTVAVHPQAQGRGIGRALFTRLLAQIQERFPAVVRVELLARESNQHAIALYESLGFRREGRLEARVRGAGGALEADIPMAWMKPGPAR
jgi:ribosomal protein S18 acetylase RimI-like enzyme